MKKKWYTPLTVLLSLSIIVVLTKFIPGFKWFLDYAANWFMDAGLNILLWILGFAVAVFIPALAVFVWNRGEKHVALKFFYFLCGAVLAACVNIGIWAARVEVRFPDNPDMMKNYFDIGGFTLAVFTIFYLIYWCSADLTKK